MIATMDRETARRSLDVPRMTMGEIAGRIGATTAALNKYRQGLRPMPPAVRLRLAQLLEGHAWELEAIAAALRDDAPRP